MRSEAADSAAISKPKSLTAQVVERLRIEIIDGTIPLGSLLSEKVLAERFNVSKTPVREALVQLKGLGLVDILPQRGGLVFKPDPDQVRQLCEIRTELECIALRLSMARNRDALATLLETIVRDMEDVFSLDAPTPYQNLDACFHNALFVHCDNVMLQNAYALFDARISALRTHLSSPHPYLLQRSMEEHRWLIELVRNNDLQSGISLLQEHIARTREFHLRAFEANSDD